MPLPNLIISFNSWKYRGITCISWFIVLYFYYLMNRYGKSFLYKLYLDSISIIKWIKKTKTSGGIRHLFPNAKTWRYLSFWYWLKESGPYLSINVIPSRTTVICYSRSCTVSSIYYTFTCIYHHIIII